MKRTAAIVCALMFLAAFLPGVSLYAAATCHKPCHATPAPCCHHSGLPALSVPCSCGHDHDYRVSGRLENQVQPTSAPVAAAAILTTDAADPSAGFAASAHFSHPLQLSIICLTRSYRI